MAIHYYQFDFNSSDSTSSSSSSSSDHYSKRHKKPVITGASEIAKKTVAEVPKEDSKSYATTNESSKLVVGPVDNGYATQQNEPKNCISSCWSCIFSRCFRPDPTTFNEGNSLK